MTQQILRSEKEFKPEHIWRLIPAHLLKRMYRFLYCDSINQGAENVAMANSYFWIVTILRIVLVEAEETLEYSGSQSTFCVIKL